MVSEETKSVIARAKDIYEQRLRIDLEATAEISLLQSSPIPVSSLAPRRSMQPSSWRGPSIRRSCRTQFGLATPPRFILE